MLHLETVEPRTFAVLKELQQLPELEGFYLVGRTALALHFGHRKSIDLDFFRENFDKEKVRKALKNKFDKVEFADSPSNWGLFSFVEGVKVDVVKYPHSLLCNPLSRSGIRLYDLPDLSAMKLNAILRRGTKKDFWDIHELLSHFELGDLISFLEKKFPDQRQLISLPQALVYFDDAENSPDPICLKGLQWSTIKTTIQKKVRDYLS